MNDKEYENAISNPNIKTFAREFLEYGENKEGYWTMKRFMAQIKRAVEIAEIKYPKTDGWRCCWCSTTAVIIMRWQTMQWMKVTLSQHVDFKFEKSEIEKYLLKNGHIPTFLPKFHPELNPIERVSAQLKRYTRAHCNYSIQSLRQNIPTAFDNVTHDNIITNHFRKVKHFMFGYLEGLVPGKDLDERLKKYKNKVKSHRRIGPKG